MRVEKIGLATLYLGDCLEALASMESESVDMIWTDPPYGHSNGDGDFLASRSEIMRDGRATKASVIANDSQDDMRRVVDGMLKEAARLLRHDSCCCCCCCGPRPTFAWLAQRMDGDGLEFFHSVIWDKANPGVGWRYRRQHEMVMVAHRKGGRLAWNDSVPAVPNVIRLAKPRAQEHPNEKPIALMELMISAHTTPGNVVLDPFMGSGSTGVAAVQIGRQFIGVEIDPAHFETACRRIEDAQRIQDMFSPPPAMTQTSLLDAYEQTEKLYQGAA